MRTLKIREEAIRFGTFAALGIVALAPLFGSGIPAQADPPDHAPAWGYRGKNKDKNKHGRHHVEGRDDDWDDDRDDGDNDYDDGGYRDIEFTGTVVSVASRYRLTVRSTNGRTYDVSSRTQFSSAINRGDRVRVSGSADGRFVRADRVTLIRNGGGPLGGQVGQDVSFRGTVTSILPSSDTFRVRGDNGRTYVVRYRNAENFRRGSRVRVVGTFDGRVVIASSVVRI